MNAPPASIIASNARRETIRGGTGQTARGSAGQTARGGMRQSAGGGRDPHRQACGALRFRPNMGVAAPGLATRRTWNHIPAEEFQGPTSWHAIRRLTAT
jgi:hypothetical protein